ncbi:Uncharacterised protein [Bordetella pertussis]|nr:Uncharacterised protein [Bordetella pertussis]CRE30529.1 Uncharacterised protein [Bordetella pertussis]
MRQLRAGPVYLFARDNQGRRQAQGLAVRVLDQHAARHQPLAIGARRPGVGLEFERQHQAAAAHFAHRAGQRAQALHEIGALLARIVDHAFVMQHPQRGARNRAGQRVAAEGAAVLARLENAQHRLVRQHRGHGIEAARQGLADQRDIGLDAFVRLGQESAGAPQPGLDLVEDEHDIAFAAQLAHLAEIARRRQDDASLALDGFDQEGHRARRDGSLQRGEVAERHHREARRERPVAAARIRVGGKADDAQRAAVEVVGAHDDLRLPGRHAARLVAPFAHRLERRLDRLGAAVHGQHLVRAGQARQVFVQGRQLVMAEGPRGQRQPLRLLDHRGQDARMAMPLVDRRVGGQAIQVAPPRRVVQPDPAAARQHHIERLVVVGAEFVLDPVAPRGGGCWHVHGGLLRDGPTWPADHLREMPG